MLLIAPGLMRVPAASSSRVTWQRSIIFAGGTPVPFILVCPSVNDIYRCHSFNENDNYARGRLSSYEERNAGSEHLRF